MGVAVDPVVADGVEGKSLVGAEDAGAETETDGRDVGVVERAADAVLVMSVWP